MLIYSSYYKLSSMWKQCDRLQTVIYTFSADLVLRAWTFEYDFFTRTPKSNCHVYGCSWYRFGLYILYFWNCSDGVIFTVYHFISKILLEGKCVHAIYSQQIKYLRVWVLYNNSNGNSILQLLWKGSSQLVHRLVLPMSRMVVSYCFQEIY